MESSFYRTKQYHAATRKMFFPLSEYQKVIKPLAKCYIEKSINNKMLKPKELDRFLEHTVQKFLPFQKSKAQVD